MKKVGAAVAGYGWPVPSGLNQFPPFTGWRSARQETGYRRPTTYSMRNLASVHNSARQAGRKRDVYPNHSSGANGGGRLGRGCRGKELLRMPGWFACEIAMWRPRGMGESD